MHADAGVAARMKCAVRDLLVARLELLDTKHVGPLPREPREKALARSAAQAVRVEGDDSQQKSADEKTEAI
jgi:hypothetical protein